MNFRKEIDQLSNTYSIFCWTQREEKLSFLDSTDPLVRLRNPSEGTEALRRWKERPEIHKNIFFAISWLIIKNSKIPS